MVISRFNRVGCPRLLVLLLAGVILGAACGGASLEALGQTLRLHNTYADGMVVQRDRQIPVEGWAQPGQPVTVEVLGDSASAVATTADDRGAWLVTLPARPVGELFSIIVESRGEQRRIDDVLAGDVWLVAGQSNMNYTFNRSPLVAEWAKQSGRWPTVRYLKLKPEPGTQPQGEPALAEGESWFEVSPDNAASCSAVGLIFGVELGRTTGVPIGLIQAARGGTPIESWMSPGSLRSYLGVDASQSTGGRAHAAYFNTMIAPLKGRPICGVAWYQGESSAYDPGTYQQLLPALITGYRHHFASPQAVFAIVQLPSFGGKGWPTRDECWPWLREVQQQVADETAGVELAVTTDLGEYNDIHPPQKVEIGQRLAEAARRALSPHERPVPPRIVDVQFADGGALLTVNPNARPLEARRVVMNKRAKQPPRQDAEALVAPAGRLHGFSIAGADGRFVEAEAVFDEGHPGVNIYVHSPGVKNPVAVRYGWANFTLANLFDSHGLPLRPYRSDDWPLPPELASAVVPAKWNGQTLPGEPGVLSEGKNAKRLPVRDDKPGIKTGPLDSKKMTLLSVRAPKAYRDLPPGQMVRVHLLIHDDRTSPMEIRYDSNDDAFKHSPKSPPGLWKLARPITLSGSNEWRVISIDLPQARFSGRADGYDLRLGLNPNYTVKPALRVAEVRFERVRP